MNKSQAFLVAGKHYTNYIGIFPVKDHFSDWVLEAIMEAYNLGKSEDLTKWPFNVKNPYENICDSCGKKI